MISSKKDIDNIINYSNTDIDNLAFNDENILKNDLYIFKKLKNKIFDLEAQINQLRQEIYKMKEVNNHLLTENQSLSNIIQNYKSRENLYLLTEENLKKLKGDHESLKSSLLEERNKFQFELRLKDSIYEHDVIQTNMRSENLKHQNDLFMNVKKLNDILYIKNDELKKNLDKIKKEEKSKLEEMEIKYNKKIDNYKKRMIEFLKKNEKERYQLGTQAELNNKLNVLHIQELINELEIQGVEVEDLLKERQDLKMRILELNHDLFIYQEVIDTLTKKNHKFENKLKKISNNIEEYSLVKNKKLHQILTEPNETSLNIKTLKKLGKARNLRNLSSNKDIIKSVENKYSSSVSSKKSFLSYSNKNNKIKISMPKNKAIKININYENSIKKDEHKDKIKDNNNQNEILFKEKEKYKDLYQFYKDKFEIIKNKYSHIFNMYNEVLEKIYNEEFIKNNKEDIKININEFKEFKFENMSSEQKYAILIKLINNIAPLVYKKDLENNLFVQNISKVKEKYNFNNLNQISSCNFSNDNSTKIPSGTLGILSLKSKNTTFNDSFRTSTTFLGGGIKYNKSLNSFDDFKKIFGRQKDQKNKSLLHFGNTKIDIELFPKVNLLE